MTDEQAETPLFQMTPTADAYMQLAQQIADTIERVAHVEAAQPADEDDLDEDDEDEDASAIAEALESAHVRIDRHRAEIEQIKRVINQIIAFLGSNGIPKTQPAESADTVQPSTRNLIP